jgi:3-oxoacyl-[acyl-carrier-protein] synthase-1
MRVFITGRAALTASGATADDNWNNILLGQSHVGEIKQWDLSSWAYRLGGELKDFQPNKMLPDRKLAKAISRHDAMGIYTAVQAVEHSQMISYRDTLASSTEFNERTAIFVGSAGNKYFQQYDFLPLLAKTKDNMQAFAHQLFNEVHPMWLLRILPNNVLAYTGIHYGFKGPNQNITNHAVSGTQALLEAYHLIHQGQVDRAVVVAYDLGSEPQSLFYYEQLGVLSARHLKPFDQSHDGTLLAEGAAALVLESEASVNARKAKCYAEVLGGLSATEGSGLFSLEATGKPLASLIERTLDQVNLKATDLDLIVAHGNGNIKSDDSEALALKAVTHPDTAITAFKWSMGHTLCVSGLLDALLTTYALSHRICPGIAGLNQPAPAALGLNLSATSQHLNDNAPYALLINRGFASINATVVMKACD